MPHVHPSGWFTFEHESVPSAAHRTFTRCTLLMTINQEACTTTPVVFYTRAMVYAGERIAAITEEPNKHLYGWDDDDNVILDCFY